MIYQLKLSYLASKVNKGLATRDEEMSLKITGYKANVFLIQSFKTKLKFRLQQKLWKLTREDFKGLCMDHIMMSFTAENLRSKNKHLKYTFT